jgi:hypothetical protein
MHAYQQIQRNINPQENLDCRPREDIESGSSHSMYTPEAGLSEEEETGQHSVEKTMSLTRAVVEGQLEEAIVSTREAMFTSYGARLYTDMRGTKIH